MTTAAAMLAGVPLMLGTGAYVGRMNDGMEQEA